MASKPISQREARALKRRVRELEERESALRTSFGQDYPGAYMGWVRPADELRGALKAARALGCVVVGRLDGDNDLRLYAVPTKVRPNV